MGEMGREIRVILKEGREKPVLGRHPWIFSGSIDLLDEEFQSGDIVKVFSKNGDFLGKGTLSPNSEIVVRLLTFENEEINRDFFKKRLVQAIANRKDFFKQGDTNAYRLVNSEGDFLPGLTVDRYADYLVLQAFTPGLLSFKDLLVDLLEELLSPRGIYEKEDSDLHRKEGIESAVLRLRGEEPPDFIPIEENGVRFIVDIHRGQKTGFFLDQREGRALIRGEAEGRGVLNAFSYTGGFSVCAALGGARQVVSVESSESAMNTARHNFEQNGLDPAHCEFVREDVFQYLRKEPRRFGLVILDPPAFAKSKGQIHQASRGYKDINLYAMKRMEAGGLLFTSSCSSYIPTDLFQKILFAAAKDARREVQILKKMGHPSDHPVSIYHPEGEYLKSFLLRVL